MQNIFRHTSIQVITFLQSIQRKQNCPKLGINLVVFRQRPIKNQVDHHSVVKQWTSEPEPYRKQKIKSWVRMPNKFFLSILCKFSTKYRFKPKKIQADNASVKHLVSAFASIKESWYENPVLSDDIEGGLNLFLFTRWCIFRESSLDVIACYLGHF